MKQPLSHEPGANPLTRKAWNPYVVGAGIGVLSILVFLLVNKPLGMSTEVSKLSGWLASLFVGWDSVTENAYWASKTPAFGYSTVFLIATFFGALLSSIAGRTFRWETVPHEWRQHQGASPGRRMLAAFAGGALLLYGARLAGGCTSGHGISGTLQLALSGWIFFAVMFIAGIASARVIFRKKAIQNPLP